MPGRRWAAPATGRWAGAAVPTVSVLLAAVLLAAIAVAARGPDPAGADTVLVRGAQTVVDLPAGGSRLLAEGDPVPRGAVVRPGRDGAVLRVLGRDTWLSADAALLVRDGARQELRTGFAMVDARQGPALQVGTSAAVVTTPRGAVSRVEQGALLRVGVYGGGPALVRAAGRRATASVVRDYQVQVPEGGLPGRATPLVLTAGDSYERSLAPELVAADEALVGYARRLDAGGAVRAAVQAASLREVPAAPACGPAAAPASERELAFVLSAARDPGQLAARYARTCSLRRDGGSWGVVADLVGTRVPDVARLLDALLAPAATAVAAGPTGAVAAGPGLAVLAPAGPVVPATPAPGPNPGAAAAGGEAPGPPPPAPSPTPLLDSVVSTVLGVLPPLPLPTGPGPATGGPALGTPGGPTVPALPGDIPRPISPSPAPLGGLLGR